MLTATLDEKKLIEQVPVGCIVEHYKGKRMKVLAVARHTEDDSLYVVYQKLYNCEKFGDRAVVIRPLVMFLENVTINGKEVPRFSVVQERACC
ncbi:MAG: DUF1653 domain-containing protein [Chlamydiales bacterium]|nr:DUF1653 domain-containing protein [Chlamydiales bacterium]